jgi:hypothetical protein
LYFYGTASVSRICGLVGYLAGPAILIRLRSTSPARRLKIASSTGPPGGVLAASSILRLLQSANATGAPSQADSAVLLAVVDDWIFDHEANRPSWNRLLKRRYV